MRLATMPASPLPQSARFEARPCRDADELRDVLEEWSPEQDLFSVAPSSARAAIPGTIPWAFRLVRADAADAVAAGLERKGRWRAGLVLIASARSGMPDMAEALYGFSRSHHLANLMVEWIGDAHDLPTLRGERRRRSGDTFIVPLQSVDPESLPSKNHRRNTRRARTAGIELVRLPDAEAVEAHLALCHSSLERRAHRGELIEAALRPEVFQALVSSGSSRFYQVGLMGRPLASDLVVQIGDAAWYLSGGTSPEGMKIGASHLLMAEIIRDLRSRGCRSLSLGFTETEELGRFKLRFGGERVAMARLQVDWSSPFDRALRWAVGRLRR